MSMPVNLAWMGERQFALGKTFMAHSDFVKVVAIQRASNSTEEA